ncbi:Non-specific serine/threonine protein kinase protein [Dioscorea alata]|uniref:Non-specific serine/threonine protein kinase protein n=1 Tax=Dioscorea alata TaxID=55571 RepID=A0ACB7W7G5_DIOAL|nr:Non-specific serine/threonine protein kinase protein [Dioscorea alata]
MMSPSLLSLLLLLLSISSSSSQPPDELRSLLEFKKGIHSDPSGLLSSWTVPASPSAAAGSSPGSCPAAFHGVSCSPSGSVLSISLPSLNLSGELHFATLLPLRSLFSLSLPSNSLSGRLPPSLFSLPSLQFLDLSSNLFYGPIPSRLSQLASLSHLNLSHNNLSGGFPSSLRNLPQLQTLDLRSNSLSGDISVLISELRSARHLDLSNNRFSGSLDVDSRNLSGLVDGVNYVNISGNELNGGFFSKDSMKLFRNLEVLDLGFNKLNGELPEMDSLPKLRVLRAGNNQLFGSLPEGLFETGVPLEELDLSGNGFTGFIANINSTSLKILNLSSNSISGSLPAKFGSCTLVDLSNNMLSGDLNVMKSWENELEVIDLSSNVLSGSFPNDMPQFESLTAIKMRNNSLVGSLPSILGSYPKLSVVDFSLNKLTGSISPSFFTLKSLTHLNLSGNHFTETLPLQRLHSAELGTLSLSSQLEILDLSNNSLSGILPPEVGNFKRLKFLNLGKNALSGGLPAEINKLTGLEYLDLSNNHFNGEIPNVVLPSLKVLNMSLNNLQGPVPENLRRFPSTSFRPGNVLLVFADGTTGGDDNSGLPEGGAQHHGVKLRVRIALIFGSIGFVLLIIFVFMAFFMTRTEVCGRKGFRVQIPGREVNLGRFNRPNMFKSSKDDAAPVSMSFSNDHLLTSASRSMSAQKELLTETVDYGFSDSRDGCSEPVKLDSQELGPSTTERSSFPGVMMPSPHFVDPRMSEQPVMLEVYSPDRLAGELFFLDGSSIFTAEELSRAPAEVLGRSSHGTSYKATLDSGQLLSVKWLRVGLFKHKKEFAKEARKIGAIRHPNIISWRAYYWGPREQERLIIADFIYGDSLALYLHESTPRRYSMLSVRQRLKIAIDVARCLYYLHFERNLPHGNLKPTNILLTGPELTARLMDYGLHRLMTPSGTAEQILNLGALGYRAPELATTNKPLPSFKADVYAFGVILMEMLTRRSAGDIISGQSSAVDLTDWVRMCVTEGRGTDCYDRDIAGLEEAPRVMDELLAVSLKCILPVNERPNIKTVFEDLCSITM